MEITFFKMEYCIKTKNLRADKIKNQNFKEHLFTDECTF